MSSSPKLEKVTLEMRKSTADKLRRFRARLREKHDLPVTQQMIVEFLIISSELDSILEHFESLTARLGATEDELKQKRRAAYQRQKKRKALR